MRLSIIIAVYNGEKTIERALNSVLYSSLSKDEYEIIIINDGSTDDTVNIIAPFIDKFFNIKLINKENGGQSTARNIGFQEARGKYIFCLDSDDYINSNLLLEELIYAEDNDLDLYPISFVRDEDGVFKEDHHYPIITTPMSGPEFMCKYTVSGSMCMYFYKTKVIRSHNIKLLEGCFQEDEEFLIRFLIYTNKILSRQSKLYYYVIHSESTMNKKNIEHRVKLLDDLIHIISILNTLELENNNPLVKVGVCKKKEQLLISLFIKMYKDKLDYLLVDKYIETLKKNKLYPLKIEYNTIKFKLLSEIINRKFLLKIIYKWN